MSSRLKHALLIGIAVIALFVTVEYGYGAVIEYRQGLECQVYTMTVLIRLSELESNRNGS
jgi:hypothetical protein